MDFTARATLAFEVYEKVYAGTESFEINDVGADLAYLMGAILRGDSKVELDEDREIITILREVYPGSTFMHPVWQFLELMDLS